MFLFFIYLSVAQVGSTLGLHLTLDFNHPNAFYQLEDFHLWKLVRSLLTQLLPELMVFVGEIAHSGQWPYLNDGLSSNCVPDLTLSFF